MLPDVVQSTEVTLWLSLIQNKVLAQNPICSQTCRSRVTSVNWWQQSPWQQSDVKERCAFTAEATRWRREISPSLSCLRYSEDSVLNTPNSFGGREVKNTLRKKYVCLGKGYSRTGMCPSEKTSLILCSSVWYGLVPPTRPRTLIKANTKKNPKTPPSTLEHLWFMNQKFTFQWLPTHSLMFFSRLRT